MKTLYYITEKIFFSSDIIYRDLILPTESYIFMPNHQSFLDGILTFLIPNKIVGIVIGYVAKIPIIGQVAKMLGFIFVYKTGGVVNMAVQKLKNNVDTSLIIFPEGARFFDGVFHPEKLRTGGFHIASQLKYKIVPIYLTFGNVLDDVNKKYNYDANSIIIVGKIIDTRNKDIATIMSEYCEEMTRLEHMAKTHIYLWNNKNWLLHYIIHIIIYNINIIAHNI